MEKHITLKRCSARPMTRELRDLPNTDGFKFFGVDELGYRHRCVVRKDTDGLHKVYSQANFDKQLIGWQPLK